MKSSKLETNKKSEERSRTISSNINGKIKKQRQGCNSFWMHNEHEVKSCTIATDDFIANWEVIMNKKVGNAVLGLVSKKPKFNAFCCMWKSERKFTSLWDRNRMLDIDRDKKNKQAGAELGQAQP